MFIEECREKILELFNIDGRVVVKDFVERFDMFIDFIRRDLFIMEKDGLLKRMYGGVIEFMWVRNLVVELVKCYSDSLIYEDIIVRVVVFYI